MAARYWVGGTGTWDGTALLKWSTTSGGLGGSAVPTTSDTVFFDANSGAVTVTLGTTGTCSTINFSGFTGTFAWGTNTITVAGSNTTIYTQTTSCTFTGTPVLNLTYSGSANTRTLSCGGVTEANSPSFNISAGSDTLSLAGAAGVKSLNFTGFSGTFSNASRTIYGNLTLSTGMSLTAGTNITTFGATSGTQTITSNTKTMDFPITFAGTATYQLVDAMSIGTATNRAVTLTTGTLDLNNNTFTIFGVFSSSSATNVRAISFGTSGKFVMTSSATTLWSVATVTTLTITGTNPLVEYTANASTGTRTIANSVTGGGFATAVSFNITAGTDTITNNGGTRFQNLNYTGFTGTITNDTRNIYGNLTIPSGVTLTAGANATTFVNFTSTQTITSNAQTIDFPLTINGSGGGGTVQLVDALTMGSSRQLTLTAGTFNSNDKSVTVGAFNYSNNNTKALNLGTSTITILSGTNTSGFLGSNAGTTYTSIANSTIVFTTTATSTFSGGSGAGTGNQFGTVTMSGLGGTLYLGSNTATTLARCITLNNTVSPCTITNACTTGFTVTNFNLSGTAGNLVTFNSNTVGTARTISQATGTVNALYLNVKDSTATGGATWYANSSNDLGNNTGWNIFNNSFLAVF